MLVTRQAPRLWTPQRPPIMRRVRPYTLPSLTLAGNEITDAVRRTGTEGDGLAIPAGFGIWPAATNLVTNGGFETNTTGWEATGATIARSTAAAKFGSASLRATVAVAADLAGARQATSIAASTGTVVSASAWMRYVTTTANVQLLIVEYDSGNNFLRVGGISGSLALTDEFAQATVTVTLGASTTQIRVWAVTFGSQEADFYIDGVQVETGSIATPYIETDGGTASRLAGRVQLPVSGLFTATQGWVAARLRMGAAKDGSQRRVFQWRDGADVRIEIHETSTGWLITRRDNAGTFTEYADTWSAGDSRSLLFSWDSTELHYSNNGAAIQDLANTTIPAISNANADIGSDGGTQITSNVLWFATGSGTLTDADAAALDALPDALPTGPRTLDFVRRAVLPEAVVTSAWAARNAVYGKAA